MSQSQTATESPSTDTQRSINLIPYLLAIALAYLIYNTFFSTFRSRPAATYTPPEPLPFRKYTPKELSAFDGKGVDKDGKPKPILLAIEKRTRKLGEDGVVTEVREERTVFDVSGGRSFYGPDGPYGNFAGRDASRGMAKQSFDEEMLTALDKPLDPLDDLSKSEIADMNGWHGHFSNKYIICGELIEDPEFAVTPESL